MKIWYIYFQLFFAFIYLHLPANAVDIAHQFEKYFNDIKTLEADFTEHTPTGYTIGKLYLSKQHGFKLDYLEPYHRSITSNGRETMYVDHELQESSSGWVDNPLISIILNSQNKKIEDDFNIINTKDYANSWELIISPKDPELHEMMKSIRFIMQKQPQEISKIEMINAANEKVMIQLNNLKKEVPLNKRIFSLQPPGFFKDW